MHRKTTVGIARGREKINILSKGVLNALPDRRFFESLQNVSQVDTGITLECLLEKGLFVSKCREHARPIDPHCTRQASESGPFVAFLPEDPHRGVESGILVKSPRTTHFCGFPRSRHTRLLDAILNQKDLK